jgi:allantoin racemase
MRILVANANTTAAITELCAASARALAAPGTEILAATPRFGPAVISTRVENVIAGHALLELLAQHAGQVDGVILAVSHDTALEAARQMMPCPVVGMTEAACLTACMLGGRFGLVTMGAVAPYRELIADRYGLGARLSGLASIPSTPQDAVRNPDRVAEELAGAIEALTAEGAESVILGGAAVAGMSDRLQPRAAVPLLDGMRCGIRMIEGLVALRLPKPTRGSYAAPAGRVVAGVDGALADLLR